jgi:hypothetical protein
VNVYLFIEAERAQQRSVKRACELLEGSPGPPTTPTMPAPSRPADAPMRSSPSTSARPTRPPRAATAPHASTPNCVVAGTAMAASVWHA